MALSPSDPAYIAEETPAAITAMRQPLCSAFGVGPDAFGAKGNILHMSGYHRSRRWVLTSPDSRYGSSDYSVTRTLDQSGDPDWVSAFDFTPGVWGSAENRRRMQLITSRVYVAAQHGDPRLANLREFAGTLDGKTVITFNCADGSIKAPFDISHLDHGHGSLWRSRAANSHTGIVDVMLGIPEVDMDANQAQQLTNLHEWTKNYLQGNVTGTWPHSGGVLPELVPNKRLNLIPGLTAQVTALTAAVQTLADAVNAGGGNIDTAAILAAVERAGQEARDAVGDLAEGGAAQVRADA